MNRTHSWETRSRNSRWSWICWTRSWERYRRRWSSWMSSRGCCRCRRIRLRRSRKICRIRKRRRRRRWVCWKIRLWVYIEKPTNLESKSSIMPHKQKQSKNQPPTSLNKQTKNTKQFPKKKSKSKTFQMKFQELESMSSMPLNKMKFLNKSWNNSRRNRNKKTKKFQNSKEI